VKVKTGILVITSASVLCWTSTYSALSALATTNPSSLSRLQYAQIGLPPPSPPGVEVPPRPPTPPRVTPPPGGGAAPPAITPPSAGGAAPPAITPPPAGGAAPTAVTPPPVGREAGVLPAGCNLPAFPTPADIANEVNKELLSRITTLNQIIQEQQKLLQAIHRDTRPILTTAAVVVAVIVGLLAGLSLKAFLDGAVLGRRRRQAAPT
jgi:hypothetical protein